MVGYNLPLQGERLDPGEFYLNTYNEFYFSTSGQRNAIYSEDWLYGGIGYSTDAGNIAIGPMLQTSVIDTQGTEEIYFYYKYFGAPISIFLDETVGRIAPRLVQPSCRPLEAAPLKRRYERQTPGEILHMDMKKLAIAYQRQCGTVYPDTTARVGLCLPQF